MIKPFKYYEDKIAGPYSDEIIHYSKLCNEYNTLTPEDKLKVELAKYNVWNVEINSIKRLLESSKINGMEKLLLEDQKNILQKEAWECGKEIYRLYDEELPKDFPEANKIFKKIEDVGINLEMPVITLNIDYKKYLTLSPLEKIRLMISQKNMLGMEQAALEKRRRSLNIEEYERLFLNYRVEILFNCLKSIDNCIVVIFFKEFTRDSPRVKEFYEEILRGGYDIRLSSYKFRSEKDCSYPYGFERQSEAPTIEHGIPDLDRELVDSN